MHLRCRVFSVTLAGNLQLNRPCGNRHLLLAAGNIHREPPTSSPPLLHTTIVGINLPQSGLRSAPPVCPCSESPPPTWPTIIPVSLCGRRSLTGKNKAHRPDRKVDLPGLRVPNRGWLATELASCYPT